jgi:DNA-binding HxlR family transcriptional regulator
MPQVTAKVLTRSLRSLEQSGLITRIDGYVLTSLGRSMLAPMEAMCEWSREHWDELIDARER